MVDVPGKSPKTTDEIFMSELKQEFIESVTRNLADLQRLFDVGGFDEIARIAHDIKGTSGIFGLDEGTEIARDLQYAAREKDAEKTKALIDKLAVYIKENSGDV